MLKLPRYYSIKLGEKSDQQEHTQLSCGANKHKLRNLGFIVDFFNWLKKAPTLKKPEFTKQEPCYTLNLLDNKSNSNS